MTSLPTLYVHLASLATNSDFLHLQDESPLFASSLGISKKKFIQSRIPISPHRICFMPYLPFLSKWQPIS